MLKILRSIFNIKIILGAIIFAGGVFGVLVGILWNAKATETTRIPATAILSIIEAPTATPIAPITTPTATPTATSMPSSSQEAPPPNTNIAIGDYVKVNGTGGEGLRLHKTAGITTEVKYVAIDSELFLVKDGPVDADGYIWWLLQDPYTDDIVGWGVANYLVVVQNP